MPKKSLQDLEDEIAGHVLQFPLPDIKLPRVLNDGEAWYARDTITIGQMKKVLQYERIGGTQFSADTDKLLRLMFYYSEAADIEPENKFEEFAIMLCGGEQWWKKLVKD